MTERPQDRPRALPSGLGNWTDCRQSSFRKTAITRERSSTFTAADLPSALPGSGGQSASTLPQTMATITEVLLDDSKVLYEKLKKQGHQTALDIRHGVCHAFQVFTAMPEARQALDAVFSTLEEWA